MWWWLRSRRSICRRKSESTCIRFLSNRSCQSGGNLPALHGLNDRRILTYPHSLLKLAYARLWFLHRDFDSRGSVIIQSPGVPPLNTPISDSSPRHEWTTSTGGKNEESYLHVENFPCTGTSNHTWFCRASIRGSADGDDCAQLSK